MKQPTDEEIRPRAHELWKGYGEPITDDEGAVSIWLEAEGFMIEERRVAEGLLES